MWIVIFLGGALLTGYALYPSGSQRIGQQISVSSLRTYVSDRVENLFLATHSWGEYKLKCPNCGAADYCANLDKKKKK